MTLPDVEALQPAAEPDTGVMADPDQPLERRGDHVAEAVGDHAGGRVVGHRRRSPVSWVGRRISTALPERGRPAAIGRRASGRSVADVTAYSGKRRSAIGTSAKRGS
jgi:hypothetical protein